ncbi:MAG: ribosome maturation factor RimP [Epsilonproteobacteria bacterium]|nr:ribosome maturation factor RimP [Campylobacterota bacterium]
MDRETLKSLVENCGVELYDTEVVTENGRKIYRVYITSKDGISLDKCEEVTKVISPILDTNPPIEGQYYLEVSSPGVERKLRSIENFKASIGELVKVQTHENEKIKGKLLKVDEDDKILIREEKSGELKELDYEDIEKARTYYKW